MGQLGAFGAQEFASRRHVVKQVTHFHRGALWMRLRHHFAKAAAVDAQLRAMLGIACARHQPKTTDRGHRRQRLAAKAQAGHRFQILHAGNLAGGMAAYRQWQLLGGNAATIVADADQAHPAFFQINVDTPRTGIQRVFNQFFDHRRRTLDDFAGGNLVDEDFGELTNIHPTSLAGVAR